MRFSALKVLTEGLTGNRGWRAHWRDPEPAEEYDIIIISDGGHGLSTAYYLAKEYGLKKIAVLEKGHIGSGNIERNTTIIRANYFLLGKSKFWVMVFRSMARTLVHDLTIAMESVAAREKKV